MYLPAHEELRITSDLHPCTESGPLPVILISRVKLRREHAAADGADNAIAAVDCEKLWPPHPMAMPAGATPYSDGIVFFSQGNLTTESNGGLYYMPYLNDKPPVPLVTVFFGKDFNSPYDVASTRDGALWFTDPHFGYEMGFRKKPLLPCHVYRFHPGDGNGKRNGDLRVVADELCSPTGIAFSPDESTVYITDTDSARAFGMQDVSW